MAIFGLPNYIISVFHEKSKGDLKSREVSHHHCRKHSNCPGFAGTVPVFGMLSRCSGLNQFVPVFRFFTKKCLYSLDFTSSVIICINKCFFFHYLTLSFIVIHTLNAIKNNNSFELNKNVILKTFDSNFRKT